MSLIADYTNLNKWIKRRRGRLSQLARRMEEKRQTLHTRIFTYKLDQPTMNRIKGYMKQIEVEEKQAIEQHHYLKRWASKGNERKQKLALKLKISNEALRLILKAKGDERYILLKYGVYNVKSYIAEVVADEAALRKHLRGIEGVERIVKNKYYTFDHLKDMLNDIQEMANYGNHDGALLAQEVETGKYKVLSSGYDSVHEGMLPTHVCERDNPHIHSLKMVRMNMNKGDIRNETGDVIALSTSGPCIYCARGLLKLGVSAIYYRLEPELLDGIKLLQDNNVKVIKNNLS